ncbi:ARS binding protein 2-domain-containing protein [Helicostylum pulchrum]|nr:ARS binding protein 2-domain-containing protein [Helicostylum pulchrum]
MNLSDLVHRTAGDNKVLTTTSRNTNLFQQTPSTANDTLEQLFSMPNTQWMNTSIFFTSNPDSTTFTNQQQQQIQPAPPTPPAPAPPPPQPLPRQQIQLPHQIKQQDKSLPPQNTPKSIQPYPSSSSSSSIIHSETATAATMIKKPVMLRPIVTGENVTKDNIEDGYIQFVLTHDANYISDGIESLMHAKRKFSSVPKTGDLTYTTWDIYSLVLKLHNRDIKNWSQLVGQLGLADMAGRPQFAQRVKRWMHRYKIDCYFDYLLGNKYYFNAPNEKYSGCLMMGNYKKRRPNIEPESQSEEEEEFVSDEHRLPILLAGSRKRMRDHSQNSLQLYETKPREDSTDPEDLFENPVDYGEEEEEEEEELQESDIELNMQNHHQEDDDHDDDEEEEEDELASTSSSPGSPVIINRVLNPVSPKICLPTPPSCSNCSQYENTILSMKLETNRLKAYIATLENTVEQHNSVNARMNKLVRLKDRTERWRKQLIEDLARGPSLISDDDEEDEEEEEETTDGDT